MKRKCDECNKSVKENEEMYIILDEDFSKARYRICENCIEEHDYDMTESEYKETKDRL